jgi:hypothetical protein
MTKNSAKKLEKHAEKIGFNKPKIWYHRMDGWWLESGMIEEYLGADSVGAMKKLTELSEGIYAEKMVITPVIGGIYKWKEYFVKAHTIKKRSKLVKVCGTNDSRKSISWLHWLNFDDLVKV